MSGGSSCPKRMHICPASGFPIRTNPRARSRVRESDCLYQASLLLSWILREAASEAGAAGGERVRAPFFVRSERLIAGCGAPSMDLQRLVLLLLLPLPSGCGSHQRFTHVDKQNPYIMFDQKTAQSCWAGPAEGPAERSANTLSGEFGDGELTPAEAGELGLNSSPANPPHLPFCNDLK
jgi:hypothetical protein